MENIRSPKALSHEQLGSCAGVIEADMEFARKKAWDLHKIKVCHVQACEKFSDHRTELLSRELSHPGQTVTMKIGGSLWTAAQLST